MYLSLDKTFQKLIFFIYAKTLRVSMHVCLGFLSCADDSLEECLGKQTWEDEEESPGGRKGACSDHLLHIERWPLELTL